MEALVPIIIQIVTGIIGGEAAGAAFKRVAMSHAVKIISGAVGGLGGAAILNGLMGGMVDPAAAGDLASSLNLENIVGGAGGGAILTGIVGAVMGAINKR